MNKKTLCIYHHGCADGFAAAWAVRLCWGEDHVDFHPGIYGDPPPDVSGRDVIIVDFSYPRQVLLAMIEQSASVVILDHHATAAADLVGLADQIGRPTKALTVFDMQRSGAVITWDYLFPTSRPPLVFDHIQDRDLWRFHLPMTREIVTAVYSYPMDFETWDGLMSTPVLKLEHEGRILLRKHRADVEQLAKNATRRMNFGDLLVPVANVPYMFASDVGHVLAEGEPFAATYYDDATGRRWSLRSREGGADVSMIARAMGGGGHKHAAGFRQTREEAIDFEIASGVF